MDKEIWVRADVPDSKEERKNIVLSALETGIDTAIVRPGDEDFAKLGLCVENAQDDYFNVANTYGNIRAAITVLNTPAEDTTVDDTTNE